jgi:signal transduction histidine kinase
MDSELISKVLSNLIDNAIKYSPENTEVFITTRESGNRIIITIRDEGPGIPESEIPNLFSRFYRVKNDNTYRVKGTGLGLYLSKYFIEAHQGSIELASPPGLGTTFTISLPVALEDQDVVQPGLQFQNSKTKPAGKKENVYA